MTDSHAKAASEATIWHDVECGAYVADLPLWRSLAQDAGGRVLDIGAGTGRVALDLARRGHDVTAVERERELVEALVARAGPLTVEAVIGDARRIRLGRQFALCVVPMQTIQLLGGAGGRAAFLERALAHLEAGARLAAAVAEELPPFGAADIGELPAPDMLERDGWVYASQPVAIRRNRDATVLERLRETVAPDGTRTTARDVVRLDALSAESLGREARDAGFEVLPPVDVPATDDHAASRVVMLRA